MLSLQEFLKLPSWITRTYPNPGEFEIPIAIQSLLPDAVAEARTLHVRPTRGISRRICRPGSRRRFRTSQHLQGRQLSFLEFAYPEDQTLVGARRNKKLERSATSTRFSPVTAAGWRIR